MSRDIGSSLFLLLVSIVICIKSFHMGIGSARNPGTAYFAVLSAGVLGVLSLALLLNAFFSKQKREDRGPVFAKTYARGVFVVASLVGYAITMPVLGYIIATFLLMTLLFWVFNTRSMRWLASSVAFSVLATAASYGLFVTLLNCQFPRGYFGI